MRAVLGWYKEAQLAWWTLLGALDQMLQYSACLITLHNRDLSLLLLLLLDVLHPHTQFPMSLPCRIEGEVTAELSR